jgi:hypothetical protein
MTSGIYTPAENDDFDDDDGDCFMCGGSGILEDSCECEMFEDVCMCLEPEPRECPECLHRAQPEELAKLHSKEAT